MNLYRIAVSLLLATPMAAQSFIQMSDPQFGMFSKNANFAHETLNFDFAVATANRLKPAFVVVTGDLVNQAGDAAQIAEYKRISAKLDPQIKLYSVPGNHDVENEPTAATLSAYRERFGRDYYSFRSGDVAGFVLNSNLEKAPQNVPAEAAQMEAWLRAELTKAKGEGVKHLIVFQHHPMYLKDPQEADQYFNIPLATRQRYLKLLHEFGVKYVFTGHYHRNAGGMDGDLEMIVTGPVGMPLAEGRSGLRIATVSTSGVTHKYYDFGEIPETLTPAKAETTPAK